MATVTLTPGGRFPEGEKVRLVPRVGDWYAPGGEGVAEAKVGPQGAEFENVEPGWYYAVAEVDGVERAVAVTAKDDDGTLPARTPQASTDTPRKPAEMAQFHPQPGSNREVITGARSSMDLKFRKGASEAEKAKIVNTAIPAAHVPVEDEDAEDHPAPGAKQADAVDVPQRSATPVGTATPVTYAGEKLQPHPSQDDIDPNQPQRSATQSGEATPVAPAGDDPAQQDDPNRVGQSEAPDEAEKAKRREQRETEKAKREAESEKRKADERAEKLDKRGTKQDKRGEAQDKRDKK
jgi:hypothetical protein